jgi:hypothetical protein
VRGISRWEASGRLGRMAKGEGRKSPCPDAVNSTIVKNVTTTDRSGNAKALLQYMLKINIISLGHSLVV